MYHRFYGLFRPPFAVTPDPTILYMSKMHREALATIIYGVETRKGFIVCTGEVGTGKTTIIRAFCDQASTKDYKIVYVFMPQIMREQLMQHLCDELGVEASPNTNTIVQRLHIKLLELYTANQTVALLIDEAQHLPADTLEFLRLLSNLETDSEKLLQIVLVGQPELDEILARHDMRQVNQRVTLRAWLDRLAEEESLEYIDYRLRATGASNTEDVLSRGAARTIALTARGVPRLINIFADNVLISGFGLEEKPVSARTARRVLKAFIRSNNNRRTGSSGLLQRPAYGVADRSCPRQWPFRRRAWIGAAAATAALALLIWQVPLKDSITGERLFASGLFAQAESLLHVGDRDPPDERPLKNSVNTPEAHGELASSLQADQQHLPTLESTDDASTASPPAATTPSAAPVSDVAPMPPTRSETPATPALSAVDIAALLTRGNELFGRRDIVSARLYFQRAADAGDAQAALWMGATFDPIFLDRLGVRGVPGDLGEGRFWYRRARDGGVPEAARRLENLEAKSKEQGLP